MGRLLNMLYSTRSFLTLTRSVSEASQPISSLTLRVSISPRCNVSVWAEWSINLPGPQCVRGCNLHVWHRSPFVVGWTEQEVAFYDYSITRSFGKLVTSRRPQGPFSVRRCRDGRG